MGNLMPILIKGEKLATDAKKIRGGGPVKLPYTYEESRERIIEDINDISKTIVEEKKYFLEDEIILSVKMSEKFLAKSYKPEFLEKKEKMKFVGARIYKREKDDNNEEIKSKLYFIKCSKDNLEWFLKDLEEDVLKKTQRDELRKIEKIDILSSEEKKLGFNLDDDVEINVEIILHPIDKNTDFAIKEITDFLMDGFTVKKYENGPIFILGNIEKKNIDQIAKFNFLRTVHPMRNIELPEVRTNDKIKLPKKPKATGSKKIKVGVFDGGVNSNNKYLEKFVNENNVASLPSCEEYLEHGNNVCASVLYGSLNKYLDTDILEEPKCFVESFRVLPEKNMYIVIDNIEKIVNDRSDIDIFNISFGPRGPILDDQINRFTYALDKLALKGKVFCIAVGNDGDVTSPFNRIQVPSDSVNNIGVGAYSEYNNDIYRATYSCVGKGREGAKIKPDVLEFGGDSRNLFQSININGDSRTVTAGTSFASPVVAKKLAELRWLSSDIDTLAGRTLLIHSAENKLNNAIEEGFGIVKNDIADIINCNEKKVTVLYRGSIFPTRSMKLPIPIPSNIDKNATIKFSWTICTITDINTLDSDLYTNKCIEDTFYPNSNKYSFRKGSKSKNKDLIKDEAEIGSLLSQGYTKSINPVSGQANYRTEEERRLDFKWDTITRKTINKRSSSVSNPSIILTATARDENDLARLEFCVVATIEISKYKGNLYEDIQNEYDILTPAQVDIEIENKIQNRVK